MKPVIICKDYRIFRIVCDMYGFDPKRVQFASEEMFLRGLDRATPIFKYYSAGYPYWLKPSVMDGIDERFTNKFSLNEINSDRRFYFSEDIHKV